MTGPDQRVKAKALQWAKNQYRLAVESALRLVETEYYPQDWGGPWDGPNANEYNRFNRLAISETRATIKALRDLFLQAYESAGEWGRPGRDE